MLRRDNWRVNHKRVERIWRREGLKVPKKQPKRERLWLNRGLYKRRSNSAEGQTILKRLVGEADILVENYRPGVMERFGLAYETLRDLNPRLVNGTIRGFGDPRTGKSPYTDWPAYDVVSQAMGGMMGITGPDAETPLKVGPGVGDIVPAIMAAFGILAAIHHARETGRGQFVDVGMVDVVLALCERIVYQYSYLGEIPRPEGTRHPLLSPFGMFPAQDGWVTLACSPDHFWRSLCELIGRPELGTDPRLATNLGRVQHRDEVYEAVGEFTARHTKQELIEILGGRVPFGPVYDVKNIFEDEHFRARGMLKSVKMAGLAEPVTMVGTPIHMSETPGDILSHGPLFGEHTDAIMKQFGYTDDEISAFRSGDVVR